MKLSKWQVIIASIMNVLIIGILCYLDGNFRYTLINETSLYSQIEKRSKLFSLKREFPDSVLLVDVSYDQILVPEKNDYGDTIGTTPITDREKLYKFIRLLNHYDCHNKIIMDIRFEEAYKTPYDSLLNEELFLCRDLVLPMHRDKTNTLTNKLVSKMAYSDYATTLYQNSFVKYEFIQEGMPSIASRLCKDTYSQYGPLTFCNGRLAYNCLPINMRVNLSRTDNGDENIMHLGNDLLLDTIVTKMLVENRIIVIGNMETDMHSTYAGSIPGAIINLNAYISLCKGDQYVNWGYVIYWSILYFLLSCLILKNRSFESVLSKICKIRSDLFWFIVSIFGYSMLLSISATVIYLYSGYLSNIAIPTIIMSSFSLFLKYKRTNNEKND